MAETKVDALEQAKLGADLVLLNPELDDDFATTICRCLREEPATSGILIIRSAPPKRLSVSARSFSTKAPTASSKTKKRRHCASTSGRSSARAVRKRNGFG